MNTAIGLIETKGLVSQIQASDAMLKSANVSLVKQVQIVQLDKMVLIYLMIMIPL